MYAHIIQAITNARTLNDFYIPIKLISQKAIKKGKKINI